MRNSQARKILGVKLTDSYTEIKASYRKLAQKIHPDKGGSEEAFKELQEAFDFFDKEDATTKKVIVITLEEAFNGCIKELEGQSFDIKPGNYPGNTIGILETNEYVTVEITSEVWSPKWGDDGHRDGDLMRDFKVSPFKMILGGWINVPTLALIKTAFSCKAYLAPGFQANHIIKLADQGYWKDTSLNNRGDCYLRIIPDIKTLEEYDEGDLNEFNTRL